MVSASPLFGRMFGQGVLGRLGGIIMARSNRECAVWAIESLDIRPTDRVLEIGFGPGLGIELLANRASAGRVSGIDPSPEMVERAKAHNREAAGSGRLDLRHGFADRLPFADASFDKAMAINSMQVWPDARAALREIRRVLKVGGRIALGFTPFSRHSSGGLSPTLTAAGFSAPKLAEKGRIFCWLATKS